MYVLNFFFPLLITLVPTIQAPSGIRDETNRDKNTGAVSFSSSELTDLKKRAGKTLLPKLFLAKF